MPDAYFQTKFKTVKAIQFLGESNTEEILKWLWKHDGKGEYIPQFFDEVRGWLPEQIDIVYNGIQMTAQVNDWLIIRDEGKIWVMRPDTFDQNYEVSPKRTIICPECRQGKHLNCDGVGDLDVYDQYMKCECDDATHPNRQYFLSD